MWKRADNALLCHVMQHIKKMQLAGSRVLTEARFSLYPPQLERGNWQLNKFREKMGVGEGDLWR